MKHILEAENMAIRYGRRWILEDLSFHVAPGEVYALLGRNGAGKSSLVRCLLGWQRPEKGRARLFDADSWRSRAKHMERVGVVQESPDLPPRAHVEDLVSFCARLYPRFDSVGLSGRLEQASISPRTSAGDLSRGQKAQLALALALAPGPELLILDDPTLGLDAVSRRAFFETLVVDLAERGVAVLLTTHDLAGAEGIADRVGILHRGRLASSEPLESLKGRLRRLRWQEGEPDLAGLDILRNGRGPFGWDVVVSGWTHESERRLAGVVTVEPLSLEDAFIALTDEAQEVRP